MLRERFGVRLFDALGEGGEVTLLTDGHEVYAKTSADEFFNLLRDPDQPLLVVGEGDQLKALSARARSRRKKDSRASAGRKTRDQQS